MQKLKSLCTRELGNRFYLLRGTMPQADMAAALGMSRQHYGRIENGIIEPSLSQLIQTCDILKIHPGDLLKMRGVIVDGDFSKETTTIDYNDSTRPHPRDLEKQGGDF